MRCEVSIPHRYAENHIRVTAVFLHPNEFQFLIGTLKTVFLHPNDSFAFQFQFLIGTLKTPALPFQLQEEEEVSIPHRYAENYIWS